MFSNLTKLSFFGKHKAKDGISFNSIVNGDKITFSVYDNNQMLLFESFNNVDELKETISGKVLNERELFFKNLVCFLCDMDEPTKYFINESADETNNSINDLDIVNNTQVSLTANTTTNVTSDNKTTYDNDYSALDNILSGNDNSVLNQYLKPNVPKIYAFTTGQVPGAVKIGFTMKTAEQRLKQWQEKYPDARLIQWWPAVLLVNNVKSYFKDFPVHTETIERGFGHLAKEDFNVGTYFSNEFFREISSKNNNDKLEQRVISEIIDRVKDEIINKTHGRNYPSYNLENGSKLNNETEPAEFNFSNTPLQQEAIDEGIKIYKALQSMSDDKKKMLLAAVMRFGKTHVAYSIAKGVGATFVLVSSAKADTRDEWRKGIYHANFKNAIFVEFDSDYEVLVSDRIAHTFKQHIDINDFKSNFQKLRNEGRMIIVFATLQDLSGKKTNESSGDFEKDYISYLLETYNPRVQKEKHGIIFNIQNDLFVIDETHYGARGATYGKVSKEILPDDSDNDEGVDDAIDTSETDYSDVKKYVKKIPSKCQLHLSGTPYQIMATNEFDDSQIIGRYSYTDMVEARDNWIENNVTGDDEDKDYTGPKESDSPFFGIPDVIRFGMKLTKRCREVLKQQEKENNLSSKLSYLFSTVKGEDKFAFEPAIIELAKAIFGGDKICGFLQEDDITRGEIFKHTVAVLPSVKACHVFAKLLKENNLIDKDRDIIIAVENNKTSPMSSCARTVDGLNKYLNSLEKSGKKSLTLTCVRLLTGASIPLWDSMLYMKDTDSAQEYDQAIFRICTRNIGTFRSGNDVEKVNLKPHVYLIDFKVDRMFKIIADSAQAVTDAKKQRGLDNFKNNVERELKKLPIYVEWGTKTMSTVTPQDFMKYYTRYNKNNSVDDIIKLGINKFNISHLNSISNILSRYNPGSLQVNNKVESTTGDGQDENPFTIPDTPQTVIDKNGDRVPINKAPLNKKREIEMRERFISMMKNILYLVICLDGKIESLVNLIEFLKNDENAKETAKVFLGNVPGPIETLEKLNNDLDDSAVNEIDSEIRNVNNLLNDEELSKEERMQTAIKKLGKLDKSEVVTPPSVAKRMIEKLDDSYYENAERILEVNSKTGEFVREIYNKYGPEVAKKVKIIASSEMTKQFIRKILNLLGLPEYNLLNITATPDFVKVKGKGKMSENMLLNTEGYAGINEGEVENLRERES